MNFSACLHPVANRGVPPLDFLQELVKFGQTAADEIFAPRKDDAGETDIYTSVLPVLGPWTGMPHRRAVMLEVLRALGMFESSGNWKEDYDKSNPDENTPMKKSAGIFQESANSMYFGADLRALMAAHGVSDRDGDAFRAIMMSDKHQVVIEYAARLLRHEIRSNGPVARGEIHQCLRRDAVAEFQANLGAGDQQASPAPVEPVPTPSGTLVITDHWLDGVKREPFPGGEPFTPECVVEHFTSGASGQSSIDFWRAQNNGVLAHLVIERDGTVIQCRPFNRTCGHAGVSRWVNPKTGVKRAGLNQYAIGIEIANAGDDSIRWAQQQPGYSELRATHRNGGPSARWEAYPDAQIASVKAVTMALVAHYGLADVTGHDCIAPERKNDPGPAFPMEEIRAACGLSGLPTVHEP